MKKKAENAMNHVDGVNHVLNSVIEQNMMKVTGIDSVATFRKMMEEHVSASKTPLSVLSSSSSSSSSSSTSQSSDERKQATLLPMPLPRTEFREKHEPAYYKALSEIKAHNKISPENLEVIDEELDNMGMVLEAAFTAKPKNCATKEDYIKKYKSATFKLLDDIKAAENFEDEALLDRISNEIDSINEKLEKKYQESIAFMHPDYTMEKWCKEAGIECHASSNLAVKKAKLHCITKTSGKGANQKTYTNISFNTPLGSSKVGDLYFKHLAVIGPSSVIGEYCDAYPNGNYGKQYGPKYPGQSRMKLTLLESNMHSIYSGSWDERMGKEDLVTPHSHTCIGFDKITEFNSHFLDCAWDVDNFATTQKKEIGDKSENNTTAEYKSKNGDNIKSKKNATELAELIEKNKKKDFRFGVNPSFGTTDRGVRCIKGSHEIYGYETKDETERHKVTPYQPRFELDRRVYYYPNKLKKEPNDDGTPNTTPLKRIYAIPLVRKECPLYRAVTYEEYIEDRKAGLVDKNYRPFKPVPLEDSYIDTNDVVIPFMEFVPYSEKCKITVEFKGFIWVGESGRLDFSHKPVTDADDFSKFFYCAIPYSNRQSQRLDHEQIPDPYTLQADINNLKKILEEEEQFKKGNKSSE
jgi:hypothetical protein